MEHEKENRELDDFLSDLHKLLDDIDSGAVEENPQIPEDVEIDRLLEDQETLQDTPDPAAEELSDLPEDLDDLLKAQPEEEAAAVDIDMNELIARVDEEPAPDPSIDVDDLLARVDEAAQDPAEPEAAAEPEPEPEPAPEPEPESQPEPEPEPEQKPVSKPSGAREKARELVSWTQKQRVPRHVAKLQKNQEQAYAEWLSEQEQRGPEAPPPDDLEIPEEVLAPRKKHHGLRNFLICLVVLTLVVNACAAFLLPSQPDERVTLGERKEGVSTILLMGTDAGSARTDAMVLLTVDQNQGKLSLVSIPRDTLVEGKYPVPKINAAFGAEGGGKEGIEMVKVRVSELIGFIPDGYIMVGRENFEEFVNLMGGVRFEVPMDMQYEDKSQDLKINLKQGYQTLDGREAVQLMEFCSGYPDGDLGRTTVQQDFLSALLKQAASFRTVVRLPRFMNLILRQTQTDLSAGNLLWLAKAALGADRTHIKTATLPGHTLDIDGMSFYILDPALTAETINAACNPYVRDITAEDLEIRQG